MNYTEVKQKMSFDYIVKYHILSTTTNQSKHNNNNKTMSIE